MHGRSVHLWEARTNLNGANGIARCHGPHGHDHGSVKPSGGGAINVCFIHRHAPPKLNVSQRNSSVDQGFFERMRAADHKADQIVGPQIGNVGGSVSELTIAPHMVLRSEEQTSDLQSLMRISYACFFLKN